MADAAQPPDSAELGSEPHGSSASARSQATTLDLLASTAPSYDSADTTKKEPPKRGLLHALASVTSNGQEVERLSIRRFGQRARHELLRDRHRHGEPSWKE